ncbi:MAG: hypothetical protein WC959_06290 [Kiritimatiellales bacterium]
MNNITIIYVSIGLVATFLFETVALIKGWFDLLHFIRELQQHQTDEIDDGRVVEPKFE